MKNREKGVKLLERGFTAGIQKQLSRHKKRKKWMKILTILGSVVVFCTTYALILPAITLEGKTWCGVEAHDHEERCYEDKLVCMQSEEGHTHTEECRVTEEILTCTTEELDAHYHGDNCYQSESILNCELAEDEVHTHTEECYVAQSILICEQEEREGHAHSEECYSQSETYICGQDETAPHEHNDNCYEKVFICTADEHEHELSCYSNPEADIETAEIWERNLPKELTGKWADDLIAVAESQLGYEESIENYIVTDENTMKGYTRYGAWYGDAYGDWCAMFVSFCLNYAEIPEEAVVQEANCVKWIEKLEKQELYHEADDFVPEKGDIIFFDMGDRVDGADHVGIVAEWNEAEHTIKTIEGNSDDKVQYCTYEVDDKKILGYGELPLNPEFEEPPADEPVEEEVPAEEPVEEEAPADESVVEEEAPADEPVEENPMEEEAPADEPVEEEPPAEEPVIEELPAEEPVRDDMLMMSTGPSGTADGSSRISTISAGKYGNYYFEYNDKKNAFTTESKYSKYYNPDSPLGVAGSFHIVAFDTAKLSTHTNGNILAHTLIADSNFGTNNYSDELTYAMYYQKLNSTSASANGHILVIGSDNTVTIGGNNDNVYINGVKIDKPNNIVQDSNTGSTPFIDLNAVNVEVAGISSKLARSADGGITTSFSDQNNRSIKLDNPSGVGYYSMTASELNNYSNNPLRMQGFTKDGNGTIIINVNCEGVSTVNMPVATVWIDGREQSTAEVTEFSNGKVIWNFINASGTTINTNRMTGMVIALGATVNIKQNLNGTVIAENVNVQAESHRTDFTGHIEVLEDNVTEKASIGIRKVDNDNISIYLQGAKFKLFKWNGITYEEVMSDLETDENGLLSIKDLTYNTAYRLEETDAPKGYLLGEEPYDFYVPHSNTSQYPYNRPSSYKGSAHNALVIKNIKNTKDTEEKLEITIEKEWYIDGAKVTTLDGLVYVDVYQQVYTDSERTQKAGEDILYVSALEIDSHQGWKVTLENLPSKGRKTINNVLQTVYYKYYVVEEPVRGYTPTYENNGGITNGTIKIINTSDQKEEFTEITLEKQWFDFEGKAMEAPENAEITVRLYQTGYEGAYFHHQLTDKTLYQEIELNVENNWQQTITGLPEYKVIDTEEGQQTIYYQYTAEEVQIGGYADTYENNNVYEGTIIIKNTLKDHPRAIVVEKYWKDANNNEIAKDGEITIDLYQKVYIYKDSETDFSEYKGSKLYKEDIKLSSADGWRTRIDNLPLHGWMLIDGESVKVLYTYYVQEEEIKGFKTQYENNDGIVGVGENEMDTAENTIIITNKEYNDYYLPETGGTGIKPFILGGCLLMAISLIGYRMKRRDCI